MKRLALQLLVLAWASVPAFSSGIDYVCDTTDSGAIGASVCTSLQTTIAGQYASIFSNANAVIYIQYGSIGSDVGENTQYYNTVSYQTYYNALSANESGAPTSPRSAACLAVQPWATGVPPARIRS